MINLRPSRPRVNQIYNMDCVEGMRLLPTNSVDIVVTSPPYNMNLRINQGKYCKRTQSKTDLSTKYIHFSDDLTMDEYFDFIDKSLSEMLRVSSLVFMNVQFLTGNKRALFEIIGKYKDLLKEIIVWDKITSEPAIGERVLNSRFEVILVFDKENAISRQFDKAEFERGTLENLWQIKRGKSQVKGHFATFPELLADTILLNFTEKDDIVLDPFMGTGTTALSCIKHNRKFMGFEINEAYHKASIKRIQNAQKQITIEELLG